MLNLHIHRMSEGCFNFSYFLKEINPLHLHILNPLHRTTKYPTILFRIKSRYIKSYIYTDKIKTIFIPHKNTGRETKRDSEVTES